MFAWDSIAIRPDGKIIPCCAFSGSSSVELSTDISTPGSNIRNHPEWIQLRKNMLNGIKVDSCKSCYQRESQGHFSLRTRYTEKATLPATTEALPLRYIEANFSNLCNLACVHCNANSSSTWGAQDYKFGRLKHRHALIEHNIPLEQLDLNQVTELKIIGGEPFMEQRRFADLMEKLDLPNLTLRISTNGTMLPNDRLKYLIDQCQRVFITVSLDGIYQTSDWFRWPSKFNQIQEVMTQFENWWGDNNKYNLFIKNCVNLYNIWTMDQFVNYTNQHHPQWKVYFDFVTTPTWQDICLMTDTLKQMMKLKLQSWHDTIEVNVDSQAGNPFLRALNHLDGTTRSTWQEFQQHTTRLGQERNIDAFEMIPELGAVVKMSPRTCNNI